MWIKRFESDPRNLTSIVVILKEFLAAHVAVEEDEDEASPSGTLKPAVVIQAKTKFEQLMQQLRVRESTKRSSFKIPFQIAEGVTIGVNGYGMVTEEKKRSYVWVDQNRGQTLEVVTKTEWTDVVRVVSISVPSEACIDVLVVSFAGHVSASGSEKGHQTLLSGRRYEDGHAMEQGVQAACTFYFKPGLNGVTVSGDL